MTQATHPIIFYVYIFKIHFNIIHFKFLIIYAFTQQRKDQLYNKHKQRWKKLNAHKQTEMKDKNKAICVMSFRQ
jgi:predicted membrane protein